MTSTALPRLLALAVALALACLRAAPQPAEDWISHGIPRQLTSGPGNDLEPAIAPDGRIAYQNDHGGGMRILVLDPSTGATTQVAGGQAPAMAAYPAWMPDGGLVYCLSRPDGTVAAQAPNFGDIGCNLWLWRNGTHTRLTQGRWRDITPAVAPDGRHVWFSTTRGRSYVGEGSHLACIDLEDGLKVQEFRGEAFASSHAAVSPALSPKGRLVAWAELDSPNGLWKLHLASVDAPNYGLGLTPRKMCCYAPRWSPDGRFIAMTAFRQGDPGWGIWLLEPRTGLLARIDTRKGNAKNPVWTPDGKSIVYECNATGSYRLYQVEVRPHPPRATPQPTCHYEPATATASLLRGADGVLRWRTASGETQTASRTKGQGFRLLAPKGIDFGERIFYVRGRFRLDALPRDSQAAVLVSAFYPFSTSPAWQVFLNSNHKLRFASRTPAGDYIDVTSSAALRMNKEYEFVCVHEPNGHTHLLVSGQPAVAALLPPSGPHLQAQELTFQAAKGGGFPFRGTLLSLECGLGFPADMPHPKTLAQLFEIEDRP